MCDVPAASNGSFLSQIYVRLNEFGKDFEGMKMLNISTTLVLRI